MKSLLLLLLAGLVAAQAAEPWKTYDVESDYQNGVHKIRVLTPSDYNPEKKYPVIYVLPVGAGIGGTPLIIFAKDKLADRFQVIAVDMTYEKTPWFADHPTDSKVRQESYLKDFVVPFIEKRYSTIPGPEGRLLVGFSKSGWGAYTLIFRSPDFFGYAASWDAPFFMSEFRFGLADSVGTMENLPNFRPDLLATKAAAHFRDKNRLVLAGEDKWGTKFGPNGQSHTTAMHELLQANGMQHSYFPDLKTLHTWSAVWMIPVIEELVKLAAAKPAGS